MANGWREGSRTKPVAAEVASSSPRPYSWSDGIAQAKLASSFGSPLPS